MQVLQGRSISNYIPLPFFKNRAKSGFETVWVPAPLVPGVPTKTRLESRICLKEVLKTTRVSFAGLAKLASKSKQADLNTANLQNNLAAAEPEATNQRKTMKMWSDNVAHDNLDLDSVFGKETGQEAGTSVWRIEFFLPARVAEEDVGTFAENDCYLILHTVSKYS